MTGTANQPRPSAWKNPKRIEWLQENGINDDEKEWTYTSFDRLMDALDREAYNNIIPGSNIRLTDKYKMRLYEAYFLEEFRDTFLKRNDSLIRVDLDARNSETERVVPYHEIICDKYNDESWLPTSKLFPLFHHELVESFELPLLPHQVLTYEQAKRLLVDIKGRLNLTIQNWKKSGNGKLNCHENEFKIRSANGTVEEEEEMGDGVIFVDNDCWQFCQNVGMHLGYFWCLSELNGLTDECTQNCAGAGVKMDNIRKTSPKKIKLVLLIL